jgi:catechol 2,3-dioxygenase-like lactoylglutathione lyase family enzyme
MRSRVLYVSVCVTAMALVAGFAVLYLGASEAADGIGAYRSAQDLPPRAAPDRWTLAVAAYAGGAALSVLVIVLMERWWTLGRERPRSALSLTLMAGVALGLVLALDGLLNLSPRGVLADLVPSWYAPLCIAQGLVLVAVFGLAVIALPRPAPRGVRVGLVSLKVGDLDRAARFWTRALGYVRRGDGLLPPDGQGTPLTLDTDDRTHLDLFVPDEATQRTEVERLLSLGASRVDWPTVSHVVLADPDGNLFCVVVRP